MAATGGQAPYGFSWRSGKLVVNETEAAVRRRAFELFVEHRRKGAVARLLGEEGYRSPQGAQIRDVHIKRWLECESAAGRYAINKTTKDAQGRRVTRPPDEWEYIPCPAIIDRELWERAQEILAGQKTPSGQATRTPKQLFSGLVVCECGLKMRVAARTGKYVCASCKNKIPCADLEEAFSSGLRDSALPMLEQMGSDPRAGAIAAIRAEIDETRSQMDSLEQLAHHGKITLERFGERHRPLAEELASLEAKLAQTESGEIPPDSADSLDLSAFLESWPELVPTDRQRLVETLVRQITVRRDSVAISLNLPDSLKEPPTSQHTPNPTDAPPKPVIIERNEQRYIRLPKKGGRCEITGMSRSALGDLIYANKRNGYRPPVESIKSRHGGGRLIVWASLKAYLESQR